MRIIRFYNRWKNQYRIHRCWASLWQITKQAWYQSGMNKPDIKIAKTTIDKLKKDQDNYTGTTKYKKDDK